MALPYGTRWAIYMLLGKHEGHRGVESQFRTTVGTYTGKGMSIHDALVKATKEQIDPGVKAEDIGPLESVNAEALRPALGFEDDYDASQGPCPGFDHQEAIANALKAMTGPAATP